MFQFERVIGRFVTSLISDLVIGLARVLYAASREEAIALDSEEALAQWCAKDPLRSDLRLFLLIAQGLGLEDLSRGPDLTLSFGGCRH